MKAPITATCLLMMFMSFGCSATNHGQPQSSEGQMKQIIRCRLNDGKMAATAASPESIAVDLSKIPGIIDVELGFGTNEVPGSRFYDPSNVAVFVLTFPDRQRFEKVTLENGDYKRFKEKMWNISLPSTAQESPRTDPGLIIDEIEIKKYLVSEEYTQETTAADLQRRTAAMEQLEQQRSRTK